MRVVTDEANWVCTATCPSCAAKLEIDAADVSYDPAIENPDGAWPSYVMCPGCNARVFTSDCPPALKKQIVVDRVGDVANAGKSE